MHQLHTRPKQQAVNKNGCLVIGSQSERVHVHNRVWSKINTGCDFWGFKNCCTKSCQNNICFSQKHSARSGVLWWRWVLRQKIEQSVMSLIWESKQSAQWHFEMVQLASSNAALLFALDARCWSWEWHHSWVELFLLVKSERQKQEKQELLSSLEW